MMFPNGFSRCREDASLLWGQGWEQEALVAYAHACSTTGSCISL